MINSESRLRAASDAAFRVARRMPGFAVYRQLILSMNGVTYFAPSFRSASASAQHILPGQTSKAETSPEDGDVDAQFCLPHMTEHFGRSPGTNGVWPAGTR